MTTAQPIEVRDMAIVHRTFRNAFQESAQLVRANPTPSPARVTFLADHVDFSISMLHRHHESEDELLFPLLVSRVPEQATNTEQVQREHELVATAIDNVTAASTAWRGRPSTETGETLASALDHLNQTLQTHLDDEERDIVPLAAVTLTQAEWDAVGEHSRAGIPRNKMPLAFGLLTEPLDEADRAFMKSHLPTPIRLLYGVLIQRPWNKYAATLRYGT
jgi:hemerythrin-like domain-containing protein